MSAIRLSHVSYAYSAAAPIFENLDLQLSPGWTGLVGPNGGGKTTFLHLLSGVLQPDSGSIHRHPRGLSVRLCPQRVERCDAGITAFAAAVDGVSRRIRGELRLDEGALGRWPTLSPGERKRWQIGAALAAEPELLLLDEPTNHLDAEANALLANALRWFPGIGVLVSHDRGLLEALTKSTLRCFAGDVRGYRGSYLRARSSWEMEERARDDAYDRLRAEERKLRRRLQGRSELRSREQSKRRSAGLGPGGHEHAASSSFKSFRRRSPAIRMARDMRVLGGALGRVEDRISELRFDRELGGSLFVDFVPAPFPVLWTLQAAALGVPGRVLLEDVDVEVRRDSRVHVTGPNGCGKTTLLEAMMRDSRLPPERVLVLPQDLDEEREAALMEEVRGLSLDSRGRVLAVLAALGVDPERLLASGRPSPGEARKLMLAFGLGRQAWALVLDEPTNHLDLPSVENLESALATYPGAIVLVSHDEVFAAACTRTEWSLRGGRVEVAGVRRS